ncbi:sensor histidine kinase [Tessaracoccus sp. G1721]
MTTTTDHPPRWSASWWLRVGVALLFVGLLMVATVLAWNGGGGWPLMLLAGGLLTVFVAGLAVHPRLGNVGRSVWVGLLFLATVALMVLSPDFLWVIFPLWLLAATVLPLLASLLVTAVTLAVVVTVLAMTDGHSVGAVLGPLVGALVAVGIARGVLQFEHEASEHHRLLAEVLRAEDETARLQREAGVMAERQRLAHDIHDTLAQGFSSIVLLARAANRAGDSAASARLVAEIEATAAENLAESRRVVMALAPETPGAGGLAAPLNRLTAEVAGALGAEWAVAVDPELPRLATPIEVALLRGAQGALANVRLHSGARRVNVELARAGDEVHLDIVDDGVGFDVARPVVAGPAGGYGLRALRERFAELGGGVEVESEPGGTAVALRLPLIPAVEAPQ